MTTAVVSVAALSNSCCNNTESERKKVRGKQFTKTLPMQTILGDKVHKGTIQELLVDKLRQKVAYQNQGFHGVIRESWGAVFTG
jgi:hypothetical protein